MTNKETGAKGEQLAQEYLKKQGYEIIEANKRFSKACEIDIIVKYHDTLIFVEVKTRSTDFCGSGLEAITKTKYNHIKTGLFQYLKETKVKYKKFRIDAISIILKPEIKINHLKNL
ncbi:MAG: YraN family protein [Candidatus Gastranaerophilales bacterium]|nr:YraN family protein [Candidatus Gastranaerophilales bacterium]